MPSSKFQTGFEFKKRRAFPVITGIVVAMENEEAVLEAYWEQEQAAAEKAKTKRHDAVIKRWIRLIQGLRVRKRLQEQYAGRPDNPVANGHHENGEEGEDQVCQLSCSTFQSASFTHRPGILLFRLRYKLAALLLGQTTWSRRIPYPSISTPFSGPHLTVEGLLL